MVRQLTLWRTSLIKAALSSRTAGRKRTSIQDQGKPKSASQSPRAIYVTAKSSQSRGHVVITYEGYVASSGLTRSQPWNYTEKSKAEHHYWNNTEATAMAGPCDSNGGRLHPKGCAELVSSRQKKSWKTKMTWHRTVTDEHAKIDLTWTKKMS